MKKAILPIIAVILVFVLSTGIRGYNKLVDLETAVQENAAGIDTQLQRRADLIPNLAETVRGYAALETDVLTSITEAQKDLKNARTLPEKATADANLTSLLERLIDIASDYPSLVSDTVYVGLMDELAGAENRIAYARTQYNESASAYNKTLRAFPTVLYANALGFEKAEFFEAQADAGNAPKVDLN